MKSQEIADFFSASQEFSGKTLTNENLSKHTTMNVGGNANIFLEPEDEESLIFAIKKFQAEDIKFFVLGGGSNVVISDFGLDAVISTRKMSKILCNGKTLKIDCGSSWGNVISFCKKNDFSGFEAFAGLSGTVGGALYMNASCFGLSACDNLISVDYLDLGDMKIHTYEKDDSDWGYKKSPFQSLARTNSTEDGGGVAGAVPRRGGSGKRAGGWSEGETSPLKIILCAQFHVYDGFDSEKTEKCLSARKEKGHFKAPSSGSAFKNDAAHGIIAGKIIDECGLKGFSVGGAQIAPWHGNFIINPEKKATASDIKKLSDTVKKIVFEKNAVMLESEIVFIGEDF